MDPNSENWFESEALWEKLFPFMFSDAQFTAAAENVPKITTFAECMTAVRLAHEQKSVVGVDLCLKRGVELIPTLEEFNTLMIPVMKELNGTVKTFGATQAKVRGWKPDKATGMFVDPNAKPAEVAK